MKTLIISFVILVISFIIAQLCTEHEKEMFFLNVCIVSALVMSLSVLNLLKEIKYED